MAKHTFEMPWAFALIKALRSAQYELQSAPHDNDPYYFYFPDPEDGPDEPTYVSRRMMEVGRELGSLIEEAQMLCEKQAGLPFDEIEAQAFIHDELESKARLVAYFDWEFTEEEREEAIADAYRAGEGEYQEEELRELEDKALARALLHAWHYYVLSQGMLG